MRRRCCKNKRNEGFVLLYTLWLLLGGVVLFATVSTVAVGRARGAAASVEWLRSTAAAESAVHDQMFRLVVDGSTALRTKIGSDVTFDGVRLRLDTINSDGLVDLNAANDSVLGDVLAVVIPEGAESMTRSLHSLGRLRSYAQLGMIEELTAARLACLLRAVTLSSGKTTPELTLAPAYVGLVLGQRKSTNSNSLAVATENLAGSSMRIDVSVHQPAGNGRRLVVDALVTGRLERPVSILDWYWLPAPGAKNDPRESCG